MFIIKLLSLMCIAICFAHVQAKLDARDDQELWTCDNISSQIDGLKAGNEILKLRLEMMDHHLQRYQQDVQGKFHTLEEMIQKQQYHMVQQQNDHQSELKLLVESMRPLDQSEFFVNTGQPELLREFQKVSKLQEEILTKLDSKHLLANTSNSTKDEDPMDANGSANAVTDCQGIYTKMLYEFGGNRTVLENIDSKLSKLNVQHESESELYKKSIAVTNNLLHILNKTEDSKICQHSNDQKPLSTTALYPTSCADYDPTHCANGKCRIKNLLYGSETFMVACDDTTEGGGWTVIQRRINGSVDFYRNWSEYKMGFGNLDGEFWIGLDKLHALTTSLAPVELFIQLMDHNDIMKYARYGKFSIGSEMEMYELKEADNYEGNAGDSFSGQLGDKFSTKDKDNDSNNSGNCAVYRGGAWWHDNCSWSNLNGIYHKDGFDRNSTRGVYWYGFHGTANSMKFVQMMIRPTKAKNAE